MCLRRGVTVVLLALAISAVGGGVASADHCSGDKDHLQDDSCGYYVQPTVPSETPTPSPTPTLPVTVENFPPNQTVTVDNWPETSPDSGWGVEDRDLLRSIAEYVRAAVVILVFSIGAVLVLLLPFPRKGA